MARVDGQPSVSIRIKEDDAEYHKDIITGKPLRLDLLLWQRLPVLLL
jgi:hypothetical protein